MKDEGRFYFAAAVILILLAILAGAVLTVVKMDQGQVASVVVTIMGFAALIISQSRTAAQAVGKVEEVKVALETSDRQRADQLEEIQATGKAVHVLVNNEHGTALRALAIAQRHLARLTGKVDDVQAAVRAEAAVRDHDEKQNVVDVEQAKNRKEGKPEA
jgi:hypothetical protein